jgi:G:T-mismatch repair DNA endonuclease (very short patch repair protein)
MCPRHYRRPKTNTDFWERHIEEAERRRAERRRRLPYPWIRIWECQVRSGEYKRIILSLVGGADG